MWGANHHAVHLFFSTPQISMLLHSFSSLMRRNLLLTQAMGQRTCSCQSTKVETCCLPPSEMFRSSYCRLRGVGAAKLVSLSLRPTPLSFLKGRGMHQSCCYSISTRSKSRSTKKESKSLTFLRVPCLSSSSQNAPKDKIHNRIRNSSSNDFIWKLGARLKLGLKLGDSNAPRSSSSRSGLGRRLLLLLLMVGTSGGVPLPQLVSFKNFIVATADVVDADAQPSGVVDDNLPEEKVTEGQIIVDLFGFDGLGKTPEEYVLGKVIALAQAGDGAVVFLGLDGFEIPLQLVVGPAEAMAVLTAVQERKSRRPVTHEAWGLSLAAVGWKVDRVVITANEKDIFYSNVVLSSLSELLLSTEDTKKSVDMRPSDGIALALRCRAPLFVRRKVAEDLLGSKMDSGGKTKVDPLKQPGLQANSSNGSIVIFV